MSGHRKWSEIRDQGPVTASRAAARIRAQKRLARHLRYYAHWEAVMKRLGWRQQ